jgi:Raf kinase inhibitor-like YbhB/YbcL family protein
LHVLALALVVLAASFAIASPAFEPGRTIPTLHTCDGRNVSPALVWTAPPKGTKSFALIMDDPDAPSGTFTHWTAWNIPAKARGLEQGARPPRQGVTGTTRVGYFGPCPPPGAPHRYFFKLYALRSTLPLRTGSSRTQLEAAMKGKVLKRVSLFGRYGR